MLTKWFGTRSSRSPKHGGFFRPQLEALEDRLPPSSVHGNGGNDGNNVHNNVHNMNNIHNNIHITGSFNGSFNGNEIMGVVGSQNLGLLMIPQSNLQGLFTMLYKDAVSQNATAANALLGEEATLAFDTFLMFEGVSIPSSTITNLENAIAMNESALSGDAALLGPVTYAVVLQGLATSALA